METSKVCTRCIIPCYSPGVKYDNMGMCNYCATWDRQWKGKEVFEDDSALIDAIKALRNNRSYYDCVIGLSGGKDSCYVASILAENDIRPLAVTFHNGLFSEEALTNINETIKRFSMSHVVVRPGAETMKKWFRHFFLKTGDFCAVCNIAIRASLYRVAMSHGIKWVVSGTSRRTEPNFGLEIAAMSMGYLKNVAKGCFSKKEFDDFIFMSDVRRACWHISGKLKYLQLPRYMSWGEEDMLKVIKNKLNWQGQLWQEHMDCLMSDAKEYCKWKKLGITEKVFKVSSLIRDGQINRQKAFEIVEKQKGELIENEPLIREKIKSRFDISEEELDAALKKDHLQYISPSDRILLWMKEKFYK